MKQSNVSRYAYLAGILDGEGCIRIVKTNQHNPYYVSFICVDQKDGRLVDWLFGNFGGKVIEVGGQGKSKTEQYRWFVYGPKTKELLKKCLPFLTVKKKQAEVLIRYQTHKESGKTHSRWHKLSDHEVALRERMFQELKQPKKDYALARAPITTKRAGSLKKREAIV